MTFEQIIRFDFWTYNAVYFLSCFLPLIGRKIEVNTSKSKRVQYDFPRCNRKLDECYSLCVHRSNARHLRENRCRFPSSGRKSNPDLFLVRLFKRPKEDKFHVQLTVPSNVIIEATIRPKT